MFINTKLQNIMRKWKSQVRKTQYCSCRVSMSLYNGNGSFVKMNKKIRVLNLSFLTFQHPAFTSIKRHWPVSESHEMWGLIKSAVLWSLARWTSKLKASFFNKVENIHATDFSSRQLFTTGSRSFLVVVFLCFCAACHFARWCLLPLCPHRASTGSEPPPKKIINYNNN